ncbi:MAG: Protein translocase subunit SecY [Mycoplasmataceae bacterium]|nr:MAG: Protein translocase subunit SecY [Mycoplasmataceae bacterium]
MVSNIKKRRIDRQYYVFFFACLASLAGLLVYLLGVRKIPLPVEWLPKNSDGKILASKLFFSGISVHLNVNFILGIFFTLLNTEKMDYVKLKKWRFWINRVFVFFGSLIYGFLYLGYWGNVKSSLGNILLLALIITVVNCCLLELIIQLMNQYGICNGFNLILLAEFLPYKWIQDNWRNFWPMFSLILITILFIWLINLKWEVPVETNALYNRESKILKKRRAKLGFRLSLSFMPLIQLSQLISFIYNLILMRRAKVNWTSSDDMRNKWIDADEVRGENVENPNSAFANEDKVGGKFWGSFFLFSDAKYIFNLENLKSWILNKKLWIISALFFLIFLRWLFAWAQARKIDQWRTGEMSKDLRNRGVYINYLAPGNSTRNLLKKIINKVIFFWYFIVLFFNIVFDNIFKSFQPYLSFFNWFGSVNIGVELFRQIRTKYKYIKTNN